MVESEKESSFDESSEKAQKAKNRCCFCRMSGFFSQILDEHSEFSKHIRKAKIELLEGIKALIDSRINALQQIDQQKEFTKITIEDERQDFKNRD